MSENYEDEAVRSRPEVLGTVPYLLGHHPADSLVALFLDADRIIQVTGRLDLSAPLALAVRQWAAVAANQATASVLLIGYGPRDAGPRVAAVADALAAHVPVTDVLLVADGSFFCLRCPCSDSVGVPFDPASTVAAARATLAGKVALDSREQLMALVDPDLVEQVTVGAAIASLPAETDEPGPVLRYLMDLAADGQRLAAGDAARLVRLLRDLAVRDLAWQATGTLMWQRDLWLDVTRRAPVGFVAAPASLAAWCAWQRGEHALAVAALRRALAANPGYLMARLIWHALLAGMPAEQLLAGLTSPHPEISAGERP